MQVDSVASVQSNRLDSLLHSESSAKSILFSALNGNLRDAQYQGKSRGEVVAQILAAIQRKFGNKTSSIVSNFLPSLIDLTYQESNSNCRLDLLRLIRHIEGSQKARKLHQLFIHSSQATNHSSASNQYLAQIIKDVDEIETSWTKRRLGMINVDPNLKLETNGQLSLPQLLKRTNFNHKEQFDVVGLTEEEKKILYDHITKTDDIKNWNESASSESYNFILSSLIQLKRIIIACHIQQDPENPLFNDASGNNNRSSNSHQHVESHRTESDSPYYSNLSRFSFEEPLLFSEKSDFSLIQSLIPFLTSFTTSNGFLFDGIFGIQQLIFALLQIPFGETLAIIILSNLSFRNHNQSSSFADSILSESLQNLIAYYDILTKNDPERIVVSAQLEPGVFQSRKTQHASNHLHLGWPMNCDFGEYQTISNKINDMIIFENQSNVALRVGKLIFLIAELLPSKLCFGRSLEFARKIRDILQSRYLLFSLQVQLTITHISDLVHFILSFKKQENALKRIQFKHFLNRNNNLLELNMAMKSMIEGSQTTEKNTSSFLITSCTPNSMRLSLFSIGLNIIKDLDSISDNVSGATLEKLHETIIDFFPAYSVIFGLLDIPCDEYEVLLLGKIIEKIFKVENSCNSQNDKMDNFSTQEASEQTTTTNFGRKTSNNQFGEYIGSQKHSAYFERIVCLAISILAIISPAGPEILNSQSKSQLVELSNRFVNQRNQQKDENAMEIVVENDSFNDHDQNQNYEFCHQIMASRWLKSLEFVISSVVDCFEEFLQKSSKQKCEHFQGCVSYFSLLLELFYIGKFNLIAKCISKVCEIDLTSSFSDQKWTKKITINMPVFEAYKPFTHIDSHQDKLNYSDITHITTASICHPWLNTVSVDTIGDLILNFNPSQNALNEELFHIKSQLTPEKHVDNSFGSNMIDLFETDDLFCVLPKNASFSTHLSSSFSKLSTNSIISSDKLKIIQNGLKMWNAQSESASKEIVPGTENWSPSTDVYLPWMTVFLLIQINPSCERLQHIIECDNEAQRSSGFATHNKNFEQPTKNTSLRRNSVSHWIWEHLQKISIHLSSKYPLYNVPVHPIVLATLDNFLELVFVGEQTFLSQDCITSALKHQYCFNHQNFIELATDHAEKSIIEEHKNESKTPANTALLTSIQHSDRLFFSLPANILQVFVFYLVASSKIADSSKSSISTSPAPKLDSFFIKNLNNNDDDNTTLINESQVKEKQSDPLYNENSLFSSNSSNSSATSSISYSYDETTSIEPLKSKPSVSKATKSRKLLLTTKPSLSSTHKLTTKQKLMILKDFEETIEISMNGILGFENNSENSNNNFSSAFGFSSGTKLIEMMKLIIIRIPVIKSSGLWSEKDSKSDFLLNLFELVSDSFLVLFPFIKSTLTHVPDVFVNSIVDQQISDSEKPSKIKNHSNHSEPLDLSIIPSTMLKSNDYRTIFDRYPECKTNMPVLNDLQQMQKFIIFELSKLLNPNLNQQSASQYDIDNHVKFTSDLNRFEEEIFILIWNWISIQVHYERLVAVTSFTLSHLVSSYNDQDLDKMISLHHYNLIQNPFLLFDFNFNLLNRPKIFKHIFLNILIFYLESSKKLIRDSLLVSFESKNEILNAEISQTEATNTQNEEESIFFSPLTDPFHLHQVEKTQNQIVHANQISHVPGLSRRDIDHLISAQDSMIVQLLIETMMIGKDKQKQQKMTKIKKPKQNSNLDLSEPKSSTDTESNFFEEVEYSRGCLEDIRASICCFIQSMFVNDAPLMVIVHEAGYPVDALPMMTEGVNSMHYCLEILPSLLNQFNFCGVEKANFIIKLASHTIKRYPTQKSLELAHNILEMYKAQGKTMNQMIWDQTLPDLGRIVSTFPQLLFSFIDLLAIHDTSNSAYPLSKFINNSNQTIENTRNAPNTIDDVLRNVLASLIQGDGK